MADNGTVHIVDDDTAVRQSLAFLLATAGLGVRLYESATGFLDSLDTAAMGCVVTDVRMPQVDGLELLSRLKEKGCRLPVIVMTGHADVALAVQAMKLGAVDFIEKPFDDALFLGAVASALKHMPTGDAKARDTKTRLDGLSQRERQVLDGVLDGKQNKVIAHELGLSPRTVEVYRANVMTKLGVGSLPELVRTVLVSGAP